MAIENSIIKDLSLGLLIVVFVIIVLILWKKIRKRICIVPTNKFLIIQGMLKNGFYTSNKNFLGHVDCLGKTFIRWFDFLYKFEKDQNGKPIFDELPTKVQIIKLEKKVDDKKAEVEAITKDHKPIGVIGLFEFQIEDPLIFLNLLWKGSLEETLKYAQEIFSPIIETHLEPVIRTYMLSTDDGHSIDQLKTEIGENALKNALGQPWKNSQTEEEFSLDNLKANSKGEISEYGARLVHIHITDWAGPAIEDFRINAEQIQKQENAAKLSDQKRETEIRTLGNEEAEELRKQKKLQAIAEAQKETNKKTIEALQELKLGNAKIEAGVFTEIKKAQSEYSELFLKTNPLVALQTVVEQDAKRFPELKTMLNGGGDQLGVLAQAFVMLQKLWQEGKDMGQDEIDVEKILNVKERKIEATVSPKTEK